jgi:hypothetical protein
MDNITIEYQPFRFIKYIRTVNGAFPSAFTELSPGKFVAIARLIVGTVSDVELLHTMTGIKKSLLNKLGDFQKYALMNLFDPFMDVKPYNVFIIPEIKSSGKIFCSPKPNLAQVTFAQFIFAENYFSDYQTTKKPAHLHKFIASLYLRQNHSFNENEIDGNAELVSGINPDTMEAIVINYVLIKEWLCEAYPLIFEKEDENEDDGAKKKKPKKTHKNPGNTGWIKIFENIVGDDLVNHDRYALLPLHNVLRYMTAKIKEDMKRK